VSTGNYTDFFIPFYVEFLGMKAETKIKSIYVATLIGILLWIGALYYAPYLRSQSSPFSGFLYAVFSPTCHQIPSRCFHVFGNPVAVCARCLGIYTGFLLGTFIFPFTRDFSKPIFPQAKLFIFLSLPIFMDATGNILGIWKSTGWIRFGTGVLLGSVLPFYFLAGLTDLFLKRKRIKD
jgi:uncharacterized membrane protein